MHACMYLEAMLKVINLDFFVPLSETQHYFRLTFFTEQYELLTTAHSFPSVSHSTTLQTNYKTLYPLCSCNEMLHFCSEVLTMTA